MPPAITVDSLSKAYRIGLKEEIPDTLVGAAASWLKAPARNFQRLRQLNTFAAKDDGQDDLFWALRDVSFEVAEGEVLGVIGRNGAGKSTLLKILSRITEPTRGRAVIHGRVSSLLEVGTGFHPELSGRENIYMNGTILGMRKREIDRKLDQIIDFSGVEKFLDTPIKRYSTGMKVRLAFAVAAHLEPEILIIDEVLAVGDAEFQKKCLGKMQDVARGGRTVLFVSHNMQAVSTLTSECIVLEQGAMRFRGNPTDAIRDYLSSNLTEEIPALYIGEPHACEPRIVEMCVKTSEEFGTHRHGAALRVEFVIDVPSPVRDAALSFQVIDDHGRPVMHLWTFDADLPMCREIGRQVLGCVIPKSRLYLGRYRVSAYLSEGPLGRKFERIESVCPFEVVMHGISRRFPWRGGTCAFIEDAHWVAEGRRPVDLEIPS